MKAGYSEMLIDKTSNTFSISDQKKDHLDTARNATKNVLEKQHFGIHIESEPND